MRSVCARVCLVYGQTVVAVYHIIILYYWVQNVYALAAAELRNAYLIKN